MTPLPRRRVLIVVSSYRPAMLADMQRARMLAHELPALGWDVEILAPAETEIRQDVLDAADEAFFAPTPVHKVGSILRSAFEAVGSRSPAWRTWIPMRCAGSRLLRSGRFDLVFFSTTTFPYFALGPGWRRAFGVPYVLDFHDPWVKERRGSASARARAAARIGGLLERASVCKADGLVAVSPRYIEMLRERYAVRNPSWLSPRRSAVIPFAALAADLRTTVPERRGVAAENELRVVYVGAGGPIMARSFTRIVEGLAALRAAGDARIGALRIMLHGTEYPAVDEGELRRIAVRHGLDDIVMEDTRRVSYARSLSLLLGADGALVLGVDDAGYIPSKLFSYALSGKPVLASIRESGAAHRLLRENPTLAHVATFGPDGNSAAHDAEPLRRFLDDVAARRRYDRSRELEPHLAPAMAKRITQLFEACLQ
jgi:hypothetical protein